MAWKATLERVTEHPYPSDGVQIQIRYQEEGTEREITRQYDLDAERLQNVSQLRDHVLAELAKLNKCSQVVAALTAAVGTEIT